MDCSSRNSRLSLSVESARDTNAAQLLGSLHLLGFLELLLKEGRIDGAYMRDSISLL